MLWASVSPPWLIDSLHVPTPAWGRHAHPAVAWNPVQREWFVVWQEAWRVGCGWEIVGSRVDTLGNVVDTLGILISDPDCRDADNPRVLWVGNRYLVLWRQAGSRSDYVWSLKGRWIAPDGTPLSGVFDVVGEMWHPIYYFDAAVDDSGRVLVVFEHTEWNDFDLYGVWMDADGTVGPVFPVDLDNGYRSRFYYRTHHVAWTGTEFVVSENHWGYSSIRYVFLPPLATSPTVVKTSDPPGHQRATSVAYGNGIVLGCWADTRNTSGGGGEIFCQRLNASSHAFLDSLGRRVTTTTVRAEYVDVIYTGSDFLLAAYVPSSGGDAILYLRIQASLGQVPTVTQTFWMPFSHMVGGWFGLAASGDGKELWAWRDWRHPQFAQIYAARFEGGTLLDTLGFRVSHDYQTQREPRFAAAPDRILAVWIDNRFSGSLDYNYSITADVDYDLMGIWLDRNGHAMGTPFVIRQGVSAQFSPDVAYNPTANLFMVTWMERDSTDGSFNVLAYRIDTTGAVQDSSPIVVSAAALDQKHPRIVADPVFNYFFVVWEDLRSGQAGNQGVYGARVAASGVVLDPSGIPIAPGRINWNDANFDVQVRYGPDGNYYVFWQAFSSPVQPYQPHLYVARVTPQGTVLDPEGIQITGDSLSWEGGAFTVTQENGVFVVAFEDHSASMTTDVRYVLVDTTLSVTGPYPLTETYAVTERPLSATALSGYHTILITGNGYDIEAYDIDLATNTVFGPRPVATFQMDEVVNEPPAFSTVGTRALMIYPGWYDGIIRPSPGWIRHYWRLWGRWVDTPVVNLSLTNVWASLPIVVGDSTCFEVGMENLGTTGVPTPIRLEIRDLSSQNVVFARDVEGDRLLPGEAGSVQVCGWTVTYGEYELKVFHKLPRDAESVNDTLIVALTDVAETPKNGVWGLTIDREGIRLLLPHPLAGQIRILDPLGRVVWTRNGTFRKATFRPNLPSGVYWVEARFPGMQERKRWVWVR